MLLLTVIGACLEALEDFSIGSLNLPITLWVSNGPITPWNALLVNWDPLSVIIMFAAPNL
jgi:hypothetical protein